IEAFTSILEEPSKGPNNTTDFELTEYSSSKAIKSSFCSEALPAHSLLLRKTLIRVSPEYTSHFICSSPCTFVAPYWPIISTNPALLTCLLINLQAKEISLKSPDNCPVALGNARVC